MTETTPGQPQIHGVHHSAHPTWKPAETVRFYRDILGLKPLHVITAKAWGRPDQQDFLHFFFDAGNQATIAFFFYVGFEQPADYSIWGPKRFLSQSRHTAWRVDSREELEAWAEHLITHGVTVKRVVEHEIIDSIYFRDPNGYYIEFTHERRDLTDADYADAEITMQAIEQVFGGDPLKADLEDFWNAKAALVEARYPNAAE